MICRVLNHFLEVSKSENAFKSEIGSNLEQNLETKNPCNFTELWHSGAGSGVTFQPQIPRARKSLFRDFKPQEHHKNCFQNSFVGVNFLLKMRSRS